MTIRGQERDVRVTDNALSYASICSSGAFVIHAVPSNDQGVSVQRSDGGCQRVPCMCTGSTAPRVNQLSCVRSQIVRQRRRPAVWCQRTALQLDRHRHRHLGTSLYDLTGRLSAAHVLSGVVVLRSPQRSVVTFDTGRTSTVMTSHTHRNTAAHAPTRPASDLRACWMTTTWLLADKCANRQLRKLFRIRHILYFYGLQALSLRRAVKLLVWSN